MSANTILGPYPGSSFECIELRVLTPNGPTSKGGEEEVGGWEGKRVGKGMERVEIGDGKGRGGRNGKGRKGKR